MESTLRAWAERRGYRVAWGPAGVLNRVRSEILERHAAGELDESCFQRELEPVLTGADVDPCRTVVVVAMPRSAHRVRFELEDGSFEAVLPPTYFRYRPTFEELRQDLVANGLPGARLEILNAPLKAVAVSLGLVRYGRNNVTYAPGIGSYLQLCGYLTDARLPDAGGSAAPTQRLLPECEDCHVCARACPTGAIRDDRLLLHAERCLTFANEVPGDWPEWVSPRAHHCLLGCLACQRACPANPVLPVEDSGVSFSAAETRSLLEDCPRDSRQAESGVRAKLAWLGQPSAEDVLGRNLRALLRRGPARAHA